MLAPEQLLLDFDDIGVTALHLVSSLFIRGSRYTQIAASPM